MRSVSRLLAVLFAFAALSCGQRSTDPEPESRATVGELPADVQATLSRYAIQDEDALATLVPDAFDPGDHLSDYDVYAVTYLWGSFHPLGSPPIVWNGKTSMNAEGAMRVVTEIDFEHGEEIHHDPSLPTQFGWTSATAADLDGVSFLLFVKRGVFYFAPPVLTYETAPITFSILVDDLKHHQSFHPVGQASGVAVYARQLRRMPCPHGNLGGTWVFEENTRTQGVFRGVWLARNHQVEGHLVGRFWTDDEGHRRMAGQVSGVTTDEVILEFVGTWCLTPHLNSAACPHCADVGYFVGRWKYVDGSGHGKLAGHFGEPNLTSASVELPFRGVWMERCDEVAGDHSWSHSGE